MSRKVEFDAEDLVRLFSRLVSVAQPPERMTDRELAGIRDSLDTLLVVAPRVHRSVERMFAFHQFVIEEADKRFVDGDMVGLPGQLSIADVSFDASTGDMVVAS